MRTSRFKPFAGAVALACVLAALAFDPGAPATPALAQTPQAQSPQAQSPQPPGEPAGQAQPERTEHARSPRAADPTATPAPAPPLSPETKALAASSTPSSSISTRRRPRSNGARSPTPSCRACA